MNWKQGFKRVRWGFLALCWIGYFAANISQDVSAAKWGENAVYMLFFSGGVVLFARACIWIIRGFFTSSEVSR